MKESHLRKVVPFVAALLLTTAISVAQQPAQQPQQQASALELYHIHMSKAAPGKLTQLIEAYQNAPAPDAGAPQVTPIILRHREGAEWDLITITPLGNQVTLKADAPPQAVQYYFTRLGPLSDWHGDTFVVGPSWAVVHKALVPAKDAQPVYVVSDYRSLAGHRPQLRQILDRNAQDTPGRSVLFAHVEGASWNFLTVTSYDSWNAIGAPRPQPASGTLPQDADSLYASTWPCTTTQSRSTSPVANRSGKHECRLALGQTPRVTVNK